MIMVIHEETPQKRVLQKAVEVLQNGGVIVYPTDSMYSYGCDIRDKRAIERIYRIKRIEKNHPISFIFNDLSQISEYVLPYSDKAYKIMKQALPGPYTFILKASKLIPKIVITNQKTAGIRIPDHPVPQEIVRMLGRPILSTSVDTSEGEYLVDPRDLEKVFSNEVELIIDAGPKSSDMSTVVDLTGASPVILREGQGEIFF